MKKLLTLLCLLIASPAWGQYVRADCSTFKVAATVKATCFDYSTKKDFYWNGSAWIDKTNNPNSGSITTSGFTQNTGKMLGRSSASAGAVEEITVGSNLTLSAGTLSAAGASGYTTIQEEGSNLTQRTTLNFAGTSMTCADDGGTKTTCTLTGGGGGSRTLIETFTVSGDQTSITFAATLDGNTDEVYEIEGSLINNAGADIDLTLQPNAVSTNQTSFVHAVERTNLLLLNSSSGNTTKTGYVFAAMVAKTGVGPRRFTTHSLSDGTAQHALLTWIGGGFWTDTSTNITSMKILSSSANGIGSGSVFNLYKRSLAGSFWY